MLNINKCLLADVFVQKELYYHSLATICAILHKRLVNLIVKTFLNIVKPPIVKTLYTQYNIQQSTVTRVIFNETHMRQAQAIS